MYKFGLRIASTIPLLCVVLSTACSDPRSFSGEAKRSSVGITQGPNAIVCWGDSMTEGDEGETDTGDYPELLQAVVGPQVVNMGIGGQTSSQIGVRQGGVPTFVTVEGGWIPPSRGVTVKFAAGYEPLTFPTRTVQGSILGVKGVLTLSDFLPEGRFTFTPIPGRSSPLRVPGRPRFVPDNPYESFLPIFWEGRNNLFETAAGPWGPAHIESDLAAQVATLSEKLNYLVLPVINENYTGERRGEANYDTLMSLDHDLAVTYGTHYLDIRSVLVNAYDRSSPVDRTDHRYDMIPTSLGAISAQGKLVDRIGPDSTTFTVNMTVGVLTAYHNLVVDKENIRILEIDGSTVTDCIRGYGGILASHAKGAAVTQRDPTHLNKQGYAIVANAVAKKLAEM